MNYTIDTSSAVITVGSDGDAADVPLYSTEGFELPTTTTDHNRREPAMSAPCFTIAIPTKNRPDRVGNAIWSAPAFSDSEVTDETEPPEARAIPEASPAGLLRVDDVR